MNIQSDLPDQGVSSGYRWTGISTIFIFSLTLLQTGVLARMLNKADFGVMALLYVAAKFTQSVSDFGFGNLMIQRQDLNHETRSTLCWFIILSGFLFSALLFSATYILPGLAPNLSGDFVAGLRFLAPVVAFQALGAPFSLHFQRNLRFDEIAIAEMAGGLAGTVCSIALAYLGFGVFSLVAGFLLSNLIQSLVVILAHLKFWRPSLHFSLKDLRPHLLFGGFQLGEKAINVAYSSIDKVLAGYFLSAASLGAYAMAYRMTVRPVSLVNLILSRVGFPLFSAVQGQPLQTRKLYLDMVRLISLYVFPLCLGLYFLAEALFYLWLGPGWEDAVMVFRIIVFLSVFISLSSPVTSWMLGRGLVALSFWLNVFGLAVNTLVITLGSRLGLQGLSWAVLISMGGLMFLLDLYLMWHYEKIRPREVFSALGPFLCLALVMYAVLLGAEQINPFQNLLVNCLLYVLLGTCVYLALLLVFQKAYVLKVVKLIKNRPVRVSAGPSGESGCGSSPEGES